MIRGREEARAERESLATLTRHIRVRVLNCSAEGCLLETNAPLVVNTVGTLRVHFGGQPFDDAIQVVRCDRFAGTEAVHHVGVKFLNTTPPYAGTLRYTMLCDVGGLAGWLDTTAER